MRKSRTANPWRAPTKNTPETGPQIKGPVALGLEAWPPSDARFRTPTDRPKSKGTSCTRPRCQPQNNNHFALAPRGPSTPKKIFRLRPQGPALQKKAFAFTNARKARPPNKERCSRSPPMVRPQNQGRCPFACGARPLNEERIRTRLTPPPKQKKKCTHPNPPKINSFALGSQG